MKKSQRSKMIKKFKKRTAAIKFLCDYPSDSEGYELTYFRINESPATSTPIYDPAINPNQSQNLANDKKNQTPIEDTLPKRFSSTLKSDSIKLNQSGTQATVGENKSDGFVLIDFPIKTKVSWQLKVEQNSTFASFGICQRKILQIEGKSTLQKIIKVNMNSEVDDFYFQIGDNIQITLNPQTRSLMFFNATTQKAKNLKAQTKKQGFQYYPYVYLYKAIVSLNMQQIVDKLKKQQKKIVYETMKRQEKTKMIHKLRKRMDMIKFVCECQSDSEGFQLIVSERNTDMDRSRQAPEIIEPPIQNPIRESEDRNKAPKKAEKKKPADNQKIIDEPESQKDKKEIEPPIQNPIRESEDRNKAPKKAGKKKPADNQKIIDEPESQKDKKEIKQKEVIPNNSPIPNNQSNSSFVKSPNQNNKHQNHRQIPIEDTLPKKFSSILKDDSIVLSADCKSATVSSDFIEGKVLIDFPLKNKVSWQLRLNSKVQEATIGICQIRILISPQTGKRTLSNTDAIAKNEVNGNFFYSNGDLIQLTFDPFTRELGFFKVPKSENEIIKKTAMKASPLRPEFQYYPYIFLKKGTVFLKMKWLVDQLKI